MGNSVNKYINPFTDFGFKNLFGKDYSKEVLVDFLNDLYSDIEGMRRIVDVTYTDKEKTRNTKFGKTVIYDIFCLTDDNRHLIIEMQVNSQLHFLRRAIYYLCRAIADQGEMGDDWKYGFNPVYGVYFTDFKINDMPERVKTHVKLCDLEDGKPLSDMMCLSFIQLPFFNKSKEECKTGFDQWIYVLKNLDTMETMPFTEEKAIFAKVKDISEYRSLNKEQKEEYDDALKRYRDYHLTLYTAREEGVEYGRAEGRTEGLTEGHAKGLTEGHAKGRAEGRAEGATEERRRNALNLLKAGMDLDTISSIINLTDSDIEYITNL